MIETTDKQMLLIKGEISVGDSKYTNTFKMIPTSLECPYNETIYDPVKQVLFIIGKQKKTHFTNSNNNSVIEKYYEYYITTRKEIIDFIIKFGSNEATFNYKSYFQN